MKKRIATIVALACGVLAIAAAGVYGELQKGNYEPAKLGQSAQAAQRENVPDSEYAVGAYPLYPPELEAGDGKVETEGYCSMCHSPRYITMQPPLPAATWEAEVSKMRKTYGATIPDAAAEKITHYLQAHYTPETRKR